jgi:hypothetical protein
VDSSPVIVDSSTCYCGFKHLLLWIQAPVGF